MQAFFLMSLTCIFVLFFDFIACSIFNKFFGERFYITFWR